MNAPHRDENLNVLQGRLLLDELVAAGFRDLCVCPGSRSALLAVAADRHPQARVWSHIDERAAAFFALGLGRAGRPAALVCTSGSAGAHFLPAVVEAWMDRVPLLLLTADRPPELIGCGAPQAMDQLRLFGVYVHDALNLPLITPDPAVVAALRAATSRAAAVALGLNNPPGPVHLNVPFRDPLQPTPADADALAALPPLLRDGRPHGAPWLRATSPTLAPDTDALDDLAQRLLRAQRPLLACGPATADDDLTLALEVAARARAVVLADPLSQLRAAPPHPARVPHYDLLVRAEAAAAHLVPDLVLHLGASLTSKPWRLLRQRHLDLDEVLVDPFGRRFDETHLASHLLTAHAAPLLRGLLDRLPDAPPQPSPWQRRWAAAGQGAARAVAAELERPGPLWEGPIARAVAAATPPGASLFVASSMPIRDLDAYADHLPGVRVLANRGVNGIDGLIATALGVAAAHTAPTVALLGDVAFAHDASALLIARRTAPDADLSLVVIDNDGGAIFAFLPIAQAWGRAEPLFTTPPQADPALIAQAYGVRVHHAHTLDDLQRTLHRTVGQPGLDLILLRVDRDANIARHRDAQRAVAQAVADALHGDDPHGR